MEDAKVEADLHSACTQLIFPSLVLMAVVILIANSGIYTSIPNSECHSYHPFQEYVEVSLISRFTNWWSNALLLIGVVIKKETLKGDKPYEDSVSMIHNVFYLSKLEFNFNKFWEAQ